LGVFTSLLGEYLAAQECYEETEPLLLEGFATIEDGHGRSHKTTLRARRRIVDLDELWGRPDEAAKWRAEPPAKGNR
jgi:hypothetical protein